MKRKLLLIIALAAGFCAVGGVKANDTNSAVYNETKSKGYETLIAALASGETSDNDVIYINKDIESGRFTINSTGLTIKPGDGLSVTVKAESPALFSFSSGSTITFDASGTGSLTFDCNQQNGAFVQPTASKSIIFKSVTFKNSKTGTYSAENANDYSVIDFSANNASVTLDNVTFMNIASHAIGYRATGCSLTIQNGITITSCTWDNVATYKGAIYYKNTPATLTIADDATRTALSSTPMSVNVYSGMTVDYTITGGGSTSNFSIIGNENYQLIASGDNVVVEKKPTTAYNATTNVWYKTFADAVDAASENDEIQLNEDITLNVRTTFEKSLTFKPYGSKNITIKRTFNTMWIGINTTNLTSDSGTRIITFDGSGDGSLTFDGNSTVYAGSMFEASVNGKGVEGQTGFVLKNVTIQNAKTNNAGLFYCRYRSKIDLTNVTFKNCTTEFGFISSANRKMTLSGDIVFDGCTGTHLVLPEEKADIIESSLNKPSTPYTLRYASYNISTSSIEKKTPTSGSDCGIVGTHTSYFRLTSDYPGWELKTKNNSRINPYLTSESYSLTVTSAGLSTLVLPFSVSTLPNGVTAYKLTTANSVVTATSVSSITKDEPVLIKAEAGTYIFTGDATADYSTTSPTSGALVGTYYSIDAADGNYVLQNGTSGVGFYKLGSSSNKVINPFRAYLSGNENTSAARLAIVFSDEATAIETLNQEPLTVNQTFDLQGRHVAQPSKGLYIKNGKKVIIK